MNSWCDCSSISRWAALFRLHTIIRYYLSFFQLGLIYFNILDFFCLLVLQSCMREVEDHADICADMPFMGYLSHALYRYHCAIHIEWENNIPLWLLFTIIYVAFLSVNDTLWLTLYCNSSHVVRDYLTSSTSPHVFRYQMLEEVKRNVKEDMRKRPWNNHVD